MTKIGDIYTDMLDVRELLNRIINEIDDSQWPGPVMGEAAGKAKEALAILGDIPPEIIEAVEQEEKAEYEWDCLSDAASY